MKIMTEMDIKVLSFNLFEESDSYLEATGNCGLFLFQGTENMANKDEIYLEAVMYKAAHETAAAVIFSFNSEDKKEKGQKKLMEAIRGYPGAVETEAYRNQHNILTIFVVPTTPIL